MSFLTNATDVAIEQDLEQFLIILLIALSAAILPKIFVSLRQIPYTLLLVIVGLGLALVDIRLLDLSPGFILMVFLPPLLFEAGWTMKWSELRQQILPSTLYAVGGVLLSIAGVGWALHQFMDIPWMTGLLVGACLAATDSAAVLGLFREVGAGKRLTTLLEGESLFNDGAAVVAFGVLVELAVVPQPFQLSTTVLRFFVVTGIGIGVGGLIGICVALLSQKYELNWVEQSLTLVTAYGTYLLVEELGGSGVIGVVTAGLVIGNFSIQPGTQPIKRSSMIEFWEFIVFFVNSILFLLLGDQIHLPKLVQNIQTTTIAIVAIVVSRAIVIYGFTGLLRWLGTVKISWQEQTLLWWTGLRGSVAIALALSIPVAVVGRDEIIANSFGVVWFTLLVQGLTAKFLLEKLNLLEDTSLQQQFIQLIARQEALQQVFDHLTETQSQSAISATQHQTHLDFVTQQLQQLQIDIAYLQDQHPELQAFSLQQHQEKVLAIESQTYTKFVQDGLLKNDLPTVMQKAFNNP
ncbi:MAG: sodium:proton antiporter [Leptolyngbya sp.]|nr:MAG: sodium:proton antiporter [Leptolyngbya sp.]